jgi:DNA modification methylase
LPTSPVALSDDHSVVFGSAEDMAAVPDQSVRLFVTSPPYWNLKDYGGPEGSIGDSSYDGYLASLQKVWDQCHRKARPNAVLAINVNSRRHRKRFYPIPFDVVARMRGWALWDVLIWYVPNALPQPHGYMERLLDNKTEFVLVFTKDGRTDYTFHKPRVPQKYRLADPRAHKKNARGRCLGNVLRIPAYRPPNVRRLNYHVAAFPEELPAFLLELFSDPGDLVVDPFLGSGTTLKVARAMGRKGMGYEINASFAQVIRDKFLEPWAPPDWRRLDILHSTTMVPGMAGPRKVQFLRAAGRTGKAQGALPLG